MSSTRFLDWLGSTALTIAVLSMLLLFVPGLVRAAASQPVEHCEAHCEVLGCVDR
ncbi:MAG: hypothetical protein MI808_20540 [Pseudomonadales bacterium]|nr:hypothetical protein [Pseudomonadales bacterium]